MSGHRITVISQTGDIIYDSEKSPESMDNHLDRAEVKDALSSGKGESTRFSETLREKTYYLAVRLENGDILRISSTTQSALASFDNMFWMVFLIAAAVFVLSAVIASFVTKHIVKPINNLDLDHPEENETYPEIVPLLSKIRDQRTQIKEQMRELEKKRLEFDAITENMNEGFLILDHDGKILSHNKSAMKLLGSHNDNSSGINVLTLNRSEELRTAVKTALGGTDSVQIMESEGLKCRLLASPVMKNDKICGIVLIIMDVTEMYEREKLRREFTSNVSHELKTPLTSILGYAEIMMNGVARKEDMPEFTRHIYHEAQRMIELVRDLMLISKLEESSPMPKQIINVLDTACNVAGRLASKASKHDVVLSVTGDNAEINGIPSVLEEMIYNLLDNAIKYNKKGGRASISVKKSEGDVILEVSDTGVGIPKSERERIFERFYRVDKSHNESIEGTGLGLAIVKHGAMLNGAKIELDSDDGGSRFRLIFAGV